jgi:phage baseplate assembly protein gpV
MRRAHSDAAFLREVIYRLEELERRQANVMRMATITQVDAAKGLVRVDAGGVPTPFLPWTEHAGDIRSWVPPSVGQQVILFSPSGELGQGWVMRGGFSNAHPQPHAQGGAVKLKIGDTEIEASGDVVKIHATAIELTGEILTHNGKNISHDHVHTNVEPGGGLSGPPL